MHVRRAVALAEIAAPALAPAGLLDHVLETFARPLRHELQEGAPACLECCANAAQRGILVMDPVQGIEGDDEVERVPIRQRPRIGDLEAEVRVPVLWEVRAGERNHSGRRVDAEHGAGRKTLRDLGGDLAFAAADVQDALRAVELEIGEVLVRDPLLQRIDLVVALRVPLRHRAALRSDFDYGVPAARIKVAALHAVKSQRACGVASGSSASNR
jgi:hypothetical protein